MKRCGELNTKRIMTVSVLLLLLMMLGLSGCSRDVAKQAANDETMWLLVSDIEYRIGGTVEKSVWYTYDENGNLSSYRKSDANDEVTMSVEQEFDEQGKLLAVRTSDSDGVVYSASENEYDEAGRPVESRSYRRIDDDLRLSGIGKTVYDERGLVQLAVWYDDTENVVQQTEFEYDENENMLSAVTKAADGTLQGRVEWTYDEAGNNLTHDRWDSDGENIAHTVFTYDMLGNKLTADGFNLHNDAANRVEFEYDTAGNMLRQTVKYSASGEIADYTEYGYDESGRKVSEVYRMADGSWADGCRYVYDENGCLAKRELVDESGRAYAWHEYSYTEAKVPSDLCEQVREQQIELLPQ